MRVEPVADIRATRRSLMSRSPMVAVSPMTKLKIAGSTSWARQIRSAILMVAKDAAFLFSGGGSPDGSKDLAVDRRNALKDFAAAEPFPAKGAGVVPLQAKLFQNAAMNFGPGAAFLTQVFLFKPLCGKEV